MLKYTLEIVLSCWTHRAKPKLSPSAGTARWNLWVHPQCQIILRPICPKRHDQMLWLINWSYQGVQTQEVYLGQPQRKAADTWQRAATWERSPFTVTQRRMMVLSQHAPLFPQCTPRAFMSEYVFTDCVDLKQQNNRDCKWQGTGSSQHSVKVSKGCNAEGLLIPFPLWSLKDCHRFFIWNMVSIKQMTLKSAKASSPCDDFPNTQKHNTF